MKRWINDCCTIGAKSVYDVPILSLPSLLLSHCLVFDEEPPSQSRDLIKVAHVVDPATGTVRENQAIIIEGDKVKSVGAASDLTKNISAETRVIDLGNATVLPGLIDCHTRAR